MYWALLLVVLTQASIVIAFVKLNADECGIVIRSFTPSKLKAFLITRLPPVEASYQPLNVYPERVGAAGSVSDVPVDQLSDDTAEPPWVLNATVFTLAVHCA